jgi:hypothetical protein
MQQQQFNCSPCSNNLSFSSPTQLPQQQKSQSNSSSLPTRLRLVDRHHPISSNNNLRSNQLISKYAKQQQQHPMQQNNMQQQQHPMQQSATCAAAKP